MKLTWHIVMKDLRRHRWFIAVIAAVMAAKIGVGAWVLNTEMGGAEFGAYWATRVLGASVISIILEGLLGMLFVAAVVHEDPLVGRSNEWWTRPISGARLLGAKITSIGLVLGVMPVVIALPWWVGCGFGGSEIAQAAWSTVAGQLIVVLLALPLAVLTDGFGRFLFWTLAVWFGLGSTQNAGALLGENVSSELLETRFSLAVGLAGIFAVAVTVHQFLSRRTQRGIVILVVGLVSIFSVQLFWAWPWKTADRKPQTTAGQSVILEIGETRIAPGRLENSTVLTTFRVRGVPEGFRLETSKVKLIWTWPDGSDFERSGLDFRQVAAAGEANWPAAKAQGSEAGGDANWRAEFVVPTATAARLEAERPALRAVATLRLARQVVEPALQLRVGATQAVSGVATKIVGIATVDDALLVTLVEWRFAVGAGRNFSRFPARRTGSFVLGREGESQASRGRVQTWESIGVGEVEIQRITLRFAARSTEAESGPVSAGSESEMTLVKTAYVDTERFDRVATQGKTEIGRKGEAK
jgi:hypothetical protein